MSSAFEFLEAGYQQHLLGKLHEARRMYERAIDLDINNARALYLLGTVHQTWNDHKQAVAIFQKGLSCDPNSPIANNALGISLASLGRTEDAVRAFRIAVAGDPPCLEAYANLGAALRKEGRIDEAISCYREALMIKSDYVEVLCNLGVALKAKNQLEESLAVYAQALAINPSLPEVKFNVGIMLLLKGEVSKGWLLHEYRWDSTQRASRRGFTQPLWLGDAPIAGRTILIHAEQGLGDTIQFVRYVPLLIQAGAKVALEVQADLKALLSDIPLLSSIHAKGEALPKFDFQCPILSLPLAHKTDLATVPNQVPYLNTPAQYRQKWYPFWVARRKPRIGLVWFGNRQHRNDHNRSIPARLIGDFISRQTLGFFSLQKGVKNTDDAAILEIPQVYDLGRYIDNYADTAAVIENLDLVVTVDTSVAHMAGALGKPVWILLPYSPDWRWLIERSDSPWYPTAKLFRQKSIGDWNSVLTVVAEELNKMYAAELRNPPFHDG